MMQQYLRTRIKMCGFTRPNDIEIAVQLGVDALGFVFYKPSPRVVHFEQLPALLDRIPAFISKVALFVNPEVAEVEKVLRRMQPDILQFHGDESEKFCTQFGMPYMKAIRVGGAQLQTTEQLRRYAEQFESAKALLFDSDSVGYGGSGSSFLWSVLENVTNLPVVLSGGLHAENVAEAIKIVRPYAVDVSSGIEEAKGLKSLEKMRAFAQAVALESRQLPLN